MNFQALRVSHKMICATGMALDCCAQYCTIREQAASIMFPNNALPPALLRGVSAKIRYSDLLKVRRKSVLFYSPIPCAGTCSAGGKTAGAKVCTVGTPRNRIAPPIPRMEDSIGMYSRGNTGHGHSIKLCAAHRSIDAFQQIKKRPTPALRPA